MKRIILIFAMFICVINLNAQNQFVDTTTYKFCDVSCYSKSFSTVMASNDINAFFDFGDGEQYTPDNPLKSKDGTSLIFNSIVSIMNYMSENKWILDKAYGFQAAGSSNRMVTHLILKKPKYKQK